MKRVRAALRLKTIRSRIVSMELIIIIPALILLGVLLYQQMGNLLIKTNSESYDRILESTGRILDNNLEYYRDISRNILSDDTLQEILESHKADEPEDGIMDIVSLIKLKNAMTQYMSGFSGLRSIHIFDNAGKRFSMENGSMTDSFPKDTSFPDMRKSLWYQQAVANQGYETFVGYNVITSKEDAFSCARILKNLKTQETIGFLILTFDKNTFKNVLPSNDDQGKYLLIDTESEKNHIVAYSDGTDAEAQESLDIVNEQSEEYYTCSWEDSETGWKLLYIIRRKDIVKEAFGIKTIINNGLLTTIIILAVATFIVCSRLTKPLYELRQNIIKVGEGARSLDGEFGDDEIGKIGQEFNRMVNEKLALSEKITQVELKNKQAELELLQSNINPHFLYNTLDSLYWMAIIHEADDIAELTKAMSDIFKIALSKGDKFIPVSQELDFVKSYLHIQNIRFNGKIKYYIQTDEELRNYRIIKLLLQPFVENAVYHGIEPKIGEGTIGISVYQQEGRVYFEITDDGVGMETMDDLKKGYAVKNSIERIHLIYGEDAEVIFYSKRNEGTKVQISFVKEIKDVQSSID